MKSNNSTEQNIHTALQESYDGPGTDIYNKRHKKIDSSD
jgi:hypothetical protein